MFLEIDVSESSNCPMELVRMFDTLGPSTKISQVMSSDINGRPILCDVTGWSEVGPCSAYAVFVEDSGDGVAMLIYGGNEGIRLAISGTTDQWELTNSKQWGEACLLVGKDVFTVPIP